MFELNTIWKSTTGIAVLLISFLDIISWLPASPPPLLPLNSLRVDSSTVGSFSSLVVILLEIMGLNIIFVIGFSELNILKDGDYLAAHFKCTCSTHSSETGKQKGVLESETELTIMLCSGTVSLYHRIPNDRILSKIV